jgi:hypothetical protein
MFKIEKLGDENSFSALSINNYAGSLNELIDDEFTPVSVETLAEHRIVFGAYHEISWTGSRTTDFFVFKDGKYYLAHASFNTPRKLALIEALQNFNENNTEIPYVKGLLGKAIEVPIEDTAVPVDELHEHPITQFLFGKQVKPYQKWLQDAHIPVFPIALPSYSLAKHSTDFIRPIIMRCTDNWSGIITANADIQDLYGFRGTSDNWKGKVAPPEQFKREYLEPVNKIVSLEDRDYTLVELEKLVSGAGYGGLLNGLLRMARNAGRHGLPANYDTFRTDQQ